eukprot:TRINITY_DN855_c0_g4_i1.p2 TRINITY_DN855_c0_g4~~TRINITY_DN855_c0_g4_i1.p2  ORF type:complete len:188 (+),score=63.14 TRINITY_DN855_c0_g4_i1:88-651(+)
MDDSPAGAGLGADDARRIAAAAAAATAAADQEASPEQTTVGGRPLAPAEAAVRFAHGDVYDVLRPIRDPEHPQYSLSQLGVIKPRHCAVHYRDESWKRGEVAVTFTPTVPHCHLCVHIGLCLHERLGRYLPPETSWKLRLALQPGSHNDEAGINRQVNDKERVCAALENPALRREVERCTGDEVCML